MAVRRPLVLIDGRKKELPTGDTLPGSGSASPPLLLVEVNLGARPKRGGAFTIAGTALSVGKPVFLAQAAALYTGKGTSVPDEAEMDAVTATGSVTSATLIKCCWASPTRVRGNRKFNYFIGA